jgi:hypothetical protein
VNIIEDKKLKIIYMKYFNLFKLELEKLIRWFAYLIGIGSSVASVMLYKITITVMEKNKSSDWDIDAVITKSSLVLMIFIPLLCSIFILVATRKFKELNQLIEENKNL